MKKVQLISIITMVLLMVTCFFAGKTSNSTELSTWKLLVDFGTILGGIAALGAMVLALIAMNDWKRQLREQIAIDSAIELEDLATRFYMACIGDIKQVKKHPDLQVHSKAILLCFRLKRRGFHIKEVKELEMALSDIVDLMMNHNFISEDALNNLLLKMNEFSKKVTH
ncbi:hypothetical protein ACTFQF_16390 [Aliivibrio fischeri]|uniref:hypothetical protein n=1 Tax=Aliivibrio fischeri TaxID=668 RepID=UPI0007C51A53|nr:hypothetical protein [Aliivibrio fischeri]MBP3140214.1 hypothetical protein [Aliivibrio fischeri]MBP3154599.1 hypothetical protein [Aliivibrio fischeri]MCE7575753.1 hypothetical protein [Aliivibrio fischeri]